MGQFYKRLFISENFHNILLTYACFILEKQIALFIRGYLWSAGLFLQEFKFKIVKF